MKGIVTKYLNQRVQHPSVNAENLKYYEPGAEIEIVDIVNGDTYDGNKVWYKLKNGSYVWSGGVEAKHNLPAELSEPTLSDYWFEKLEIANIWGKYNEEGDKCNILILDTGLNDYLPAFEDALAFPSVNFVPGSTTTKSIDSDCHGTHCAGLIASRANDYKVGIAPKAKLITGKISEHGSLKGPDTLNAALEEFLKPKYDDNIDIISISQSLPLSDDKLRKLINDHINKKRIVVAAIGNDKFRENLNIKKYPGFYDEVISVGACENDDTLSNYTCYPSSVDIFCYGTEIKSYTNQEYPMPLTGTSQATAIVAGICALVISYMKKRNMSYSCKDIKDVLQNTANSLKNLIAYKLISPKSIFEFLSNNQP
ncbi:MAG: S8/S53 family peptidase [Cyclobacteriaceae bacterium]|nr:S8/S53 family peptidase [Cyclobacteriaceae bacterium]